MYKRILLKLSGESLAGESKQGIDTERLSQYAEQVKAIAKKGVQVGIVIGKHCNIQDGAVLHTLYQKSTIKLGDYVSVGHNVTIHGADVDDYALIGMGATLLDDAHVGEGAIVAAGALVLKGTQIGPHEIWGGVPAKFIKKADPAQTAEINKKIANNYAMYASWYKE